MAGTLSRLIGAGAALLLAALALYYGVELARIVMARSAGGLTHGIALVWLLYFVVCPVMVGAALLNAWVFLRGGGTALPRLLRPGLWLIAVVWALAFAGSVLRGRHGDAPQDWMVFTLLYAGPAVLALICLALLPDRRTP
ncbi:hypothetical protein [Sagittula salina]|uniref:Transmembrane protein n=1 Tax=Sagittula salina TaxID=2820268 RepID=A0A940MQ51_9RHOB|nr:hypothetical protein [Sagittula salina]MBP0482678.1 hypothetical protein [Sagittula salina]